MTREDILLNAKNAVISDRNREYGDPEDNFAVIADLWNAYELGRKRFGDLPNGHPTIMTIRPHDVAVYMILLKVARIITSPDLIDHWVDLAGYAACGGESATR